MDDKLEHLDWCLHQIEQASPDEVAGRVVWADMPALLASVDVACELVDRVAVMDEGDDQRDPERQLLESLLDAARREAEDGKPEGKAFRQAADEACEQLDEGDVTEHGLFSLTRAYTRANLAVPPALMEAQKRHMSARYAGLDPERVPQELASELEQAMEAAGSELYPVYAQVSEAVAGIPDAECQALIHRIAQWVDPRFALLTSYWLLDPRERLREAAAEGLSSRAGSIGLDNACAGRLSWVRNALPAGAVAESVDAALAAYRQQNRGLPALEPSGKAQVAYMSLPDGAGAQHIMLGEKRGDGAYWSMVLLKTGYGIRDAYVLAGLSEANEEEATRELWDSFDLYEVSLATVETCLAAAAAENQATGQAPPPGLLDVAVTAGLPDLCARSITGRDWLGVLDPDGELDALSAQKRGRLINRSEDWIQCTQGPETWFEDNEAVRAILDEGGSKDSVKRRLRSHLDERRNWWAELFFRAALVTAESDPDDISRSMAVTARALLEGREIRRIPIMEAIADGTMTDWLESAGAEPGNGRETGPDSDMPAVEIALYPEDQRAMLEPFVELNQGEDTWPAGYYGLHGYLFAIATHPDLIEPSEWLGLLLGGAETGGIVFQRQRDAERFVNGLMNAYNTINGYVIAEQAALPAGADPSREGVAADSTDLPLRQWADGFCIAADAFGHVIDRVCAEQGQDSQPAQVLDTAYAMLRALAYPEAAEQAMSKAGTRTTAQEMVATALEHLPLYLQIIVVMANSYRDPPEDSGFADGGTPSGAPAPEPPSPVRSEKVGRNQPCPCGSGKKYKRCCGDPTRH
jgi:uncharacterized protein YecA (UPF0149 family)